jgi:hypothetical protein
VTAGASSLLPSFSSSSSSPSSSSSASKGKEESKTKGRDEPDDEDECKDNSTDEGEPTELGGSESERKTDLGKSGGGNTKAVGGIGNRTDTAPLAESKVSSIFGTSELVRAAHDRK